MPSFAERIMSYIKDEIGSVFDPLRSTKLNLERSMGINGHLSGPSGLSVIDATVISAGQGGASKKKWNPFSIMENIFQDLKSGNHITADDDFHDGKYRESDNVVAIPDAILTFLLIIQLFIYEPLAINTF